MLWGACALVLVLQVQGVVIRQDQTEYQARQLAEPYDAVGRVLSEGTCTLIAPTWALTAAHVAISIPDSGLVQFKDRTVRVKRTVIHPQGTGPDGVPPEVDLALIEFVEPVVGIDPVPLYAQKKELFREVVIVGYGDFGTPGAPLKHTDGKRRAVTNTVDDAGPKRIFVQFDRPGMALEFEGVGAPGDSGGPALLHQRGHIYLAGVSSGSMNGKPGQYGVIDVYMRVSAFIPWIRSVVEPEPEPEPGLEPKPEPGPEPEPELEPGPGPGPDGKP